MNVRFRPLFILMLALSAQHVPAAGPSDCSGSPEEAVMELPAPLNEWGTIVCTPFGHVISNKEGWIWSQPGAFAPVFIPSQMVRRSPEPVGNDSYFTQIELTDVTGSDEARSAWQTLNEGFDESDEPVRSFQLNLAGSLGKSLTLYFFTLPKNPHRWAIWCPNGECRANTSFMILDMREN